MTGRDGTNGNKQPHNAKVRRCGVVMGGAVGAFAAAAAMATGSAAPAKADIDALLDPIIQPLITSLSDAIAGFDPAAATDVTSLTDSLLNSLNSIDLALPSAAEPAASAASSTADPTSGTDIPLSVAEGTEPTVQATVDGASTTLLVDTGSSGLVIPYQDLTLTQLFDLGFPSSFGFSGFSGGVDYLYLTYDDATVDYGGVLTTTDTPIEVEIFSFPTSADAPANFQDFLQDDDVTGILGIGPTGTEPATNPLEAAGFSGVTVDVPGTGVTGSESALVVGANADANSGDVTVSGAPTTSGLTETVTDDGKTVGTATVSDDVDSGGVFGTIPSSLGTVPDGDTITVSDDGTTLYSYTVSDNGVDDAPTAVSGDSIDSGFAPYDEEPIFIDYTDDTLTFDSPSSS